MKHAATDNRCDKNAWYRHRKAKKFINSDNAQIDLIFYTVGQSNSKNQILQMLKITDLRSCKETESWRAELIDIKRS